MVKYNDDVMHALRQANGLEKEDTSLDDEIMSMDKKEVFDRYCTWNGLMGCWSDCLLDAVESIYNVKLTDKI